MLSFPVWCFVILVGFLMLCAALGIFVQRWERKRGSPLDDHVDQLPR
jgi:hypothetical protein